MVAKSVVINRRRLGPIGLMRELAWARRAGMVPESVFRLFRPFHGPNFDAVYDRVMADETGRRILREGRSLQPALLDFDRLRSLPSGTLGHEYVHFLEANEIDIVAFAEASLRHMAREDYANSEAWTLANRARDIHDIVHVISGYGTDLLGEMCGLAFAIREDSRPRATCFQIRTNVAIYHRHGLRHAEASIGQAFERGRRVGLIVGADWEAMLDWQLDDVRAHLGISKPPSYEPIWLPGENPTFMDGFRASLSRTPGGRLAAS